MKKILKYNKFIKEATLSGDKEMPYSLSRSGKTVAMKKLVDEIETSNINNFDIKLVLSNGDIPGDDEKVIWIRNSTITEINFSDLKLKLGIESNEDLMIYQTDSDDIDIEWAVAVKGSKTTMVRQYDRVGPSKRGNHFRETAFLITLAIKAWSNAGVKLKIYTNHGKIIMRYENRKGVRLASISNHESMDKINSSYESFRKGDAKILSGMEKQCNFLLGYDEDGNKIKDGYLTQSDISNISYVVKNHKELLINKYAHRIFKEEISNKKEIILGAGELLGDYNFYDIPELANMAKWNPSDFWIVFKGDKSLSDEKSYSSKQIDDIDGLNDFLSDSVINRKGLVGVSLKQTINDPKLMIVNSGNKDIENKLETDDLDKVVKPSRKTANIDFSWKFENEDDNWKKGSGIDCRTFDGNQTSNISLELKSKGGYVSGKAGSMINHLMPPDLYKIKEFIRKKKDKSIIREYLEDKGFVVQNDYLSGIFNQDLEGDGEKTNAENSRLQSIVFIDWLYNLPQEKRNDYITQIVDFAKSESIWSAPHLVVK
jgi:hypothetical protein